jgi:CelD/BcsL family acetyltransferase involved in cellulose biosynthesis
VLLFMSATSLDRHVTKEAPSADGAAPTTVRVFDNLAAAEPVWRRLEAEAVLTPYQRYDWIRHVLASRAEKPQLAIVVVEQDGAPVALLPLEIRRRMGVRYATIVGSDIGNADWMIVAPQAVKSLTPAAIRRALNAASDAVSGIDLMMLRAQPGSWEGIANPFLAFPHQPTPEHFYFAPLGAKRPSTKRVRNFERALRRLAESYGEVRLRRASTPEEIDLVHAEFLRQRGNRFAQMGIRNIFAEERFRSFFRNAARDGLSQKRPVLAFHALYAGDTIVATAVGTYCGTHYSHYINSTTDGSAARHSLIGVLILLFTEELAADGIASLDIGLGDFDYKLVWTDKQPAWDAALPLSIEGRAAAALILLARSIKRTIKQNDRLWALAKKLRGALARRPPEPAQEQ